MVERKYSTRYAKFQVSGYASRGGPGFGVNEKNIPKKVLFGVCFGLRYVFFAYKGGLRLVASVVKSPSPSIFFIPPRTSPPEHFPQKKVSCFIVPFRVVASVTAVADI
jgi:hypothetical protein